VCAIEALHGLKNKKRRVSPAIETGATKAVREIVPQDVDRD
jgi:hypothetical protein